MIAAKKFFSPSEGAAEGGCGGNSAAPERPAERSEAVRSEFSVGIFAEKDSDFVQGMELGFFHMPNQSKRLYRSRNDRIIAGICGGLAEYFGLDPTLIRLGFVILAFFWGASVWVYLILMVIIPLKGKEEGKPSLGNRVKGAAEELKTTATKFAKEVRKKK